MPRKAQQRVSGAVDEPNLVLPLATSYNERGVAGYTHTVTNSEDQRKINCFYEVVKNSATGKGTLTLSKRPGISSGSAKTFGTSGQTAYLVQDVFRTDIASEDGVVIFNKASGSNISRSSVSTNNTNIFNSASYAPGFSDITAISNANYVVVQLVPVLSTGSSQQVFFASSIDVVAGNPWTQITDGDFTGGQQLGKMEFLDGFAFILLASNSIINSDSNSLANWTASSFLAKQIRQDYAVGLARLSNRLLAFGGETVEAFYNAGNTAGSPLGRIPQLHQRIGLIPMNATGIGGGHYYCTIGEKIYFVGRFANNSNAGLFTFDGQNFIKISSSYMDKILSEKSSALYSVNSVIINDIPMVAISTTSYGTSPYSALLYSPSWNEWFEWNSTVFSTVNNGKYFLGLGSNQHHIYSFASSDNWQDDGTSYSSSIQFKLPTNGASTKFMPMYGVDADTDTGGLANTLTAEISTDDCVTFSTLGTIDLTQDRKVLFEGGSFTKAWMRLSNTNSRPYRIHNFLARIE